MNDSSLADLAASLVEVAVFPLPGLVFFPNSKQHLHIFEPRYVTMLKDVMAGSRLLAMALIEDRPKLNADGNPVFAPVGCIGRVVEHQPLPDGRSNILLLGLARVRLDELQSQGPYRRAKATLLKDVAVNVPDTDRAALVTTAAAYASDVHRRDPRFSFSVQPNLDTGDLADQCAHQLVLSARVRQGILETPNPAARTRIVIQEIAYQHAGMVPDSLGDVLH